MALTMDDFVAGLERRESDRRRAADREADKAAAEEVAGLVPLEADYEAVCGLSIQVAGEDCPACGCEDLMPLGEMGVLVCQCGRCGAHVRVLGAMV